MKNGLNHMDSMVNIFIYYYCFYLFILFLRLLKVIKNNYKDKSLFCQNINYLG